MTSIFFSEGSPKWTNAFANRLLIFRHDVPKEKLKTPGIANSVRYISILKAVGTTYENEDGPIVSIVIGEVSSLQLLLDTTIY